MLEGVFAYTMYWLRCVANEISVFPVEDASLHHVPAALVARKEEVRGEEITQKKCKPRSCCCAEGKRTLSVSRGHDRTLPLQYIKRVGSYIKTEMDGSAR